MLTVLSYWYGYGLRALGQRYLGSLLAFEGQVAVRATARNITKPLFQDYTRQGRIIGFFFRVFRILFGLGLYAGVTIVYGIIAFIWLIFPLLCLVSIVGGLIGPVTVPIL
jgi:hypothetical protein